MTGHQVLIQHDSAMVCSREWPEKGFAFKVPKVEDVQQLGLPGLKRVIYTITSAVKPLSEEATDPSCGCPIPR